MTICYITPTSLNVSSNNEIIFVDHHFLKQLPVIDVQGSGENLTAAFSPDHDARMTWHDIEYQSLKRIFAVLGAN